MKKIGQAAGTDYRKEEEEVDLVVRMSVQVVGMAG